MKFYKKSLFVILSVFLILGCSSDDDGGGVIPLNEQKVKEYSPFLLDPNFVNDIIGVNTNTVNSNGESVNQEKGSERYFSSIDDKVSAFKKVSLEYVGDRIVKRKGRLKRLGSISSAGIPFRPDGGPSVFEDNFEQIVNYNTNTVTIRSNRDERIPINATQEELETRFQFDSPNAF